MGHLVHGKWMSDDEILDADPVAGPLGRQLEQRLSKLREDLSTPMNQYNFRERLRTRLLAEMSDPDEGTGSSNPR